MPYKSYYGNHLVTDEELRNLKELTVTTLAGQVTTTSIPSDYFRLGLTDYSALGNQIPAVTTLDTDNIGTTDPQLIDGQVTTITYNNGIPSVFPINFYAMDLGATFPVGAVGFHWWDSNLTYQPTNYNVEGSNDGIVWATIVSGLDATSDAGLTIIPFPTTMNFRYLRMKAFSSINPSYVVFTQMYAYGPYNLERRINDSWVANEFYFDLSGPTVVFKNNSTQTLTTTIKYL